MKVYEAIAQSLIAEGVTDFFGLMGDGNMWLWGALCRNPSVKPYNARHEFDGRVDGRRLHPHHRQDRRRDGHLRARPDAMRHLAHRGLSRQDAAGADRGRNRGRGQEQHADDGPAPLRRGEQRAVLHHHQHRQHGRGNRRGVLRGAHRPRTGGAEPADGPAGRRLRLGLRISALDAVPAAARGNAEPGPAGAGDREADRRGASGHHRRPRRAGRRTRRTRSSNWPTASARCSRHRCKAKATSPAIRGTSASPAHSPRRRPSSCWPTPTSCWAWAPSLATTRRKADCCSRQAEVARIDIKPMPEAIGVIPGLYVQGDGRKAVAAINEALEARQVRKEGLRTAATRAVLDAPPHRFEAPKDGLDPRALAWNLGAALPKGALFTCGAGHFFSWVGDVHAAAGRGGDPGTRTASARWARGSAWRSAPAPAIPVVSTSRSRATAA